MNVKAARVRIWKEEIFQSVYLSVPKIYAFQTWNILKSVTGKTTAWVNFNVV